MDTILHVFVINIPYPKLLAVLWFLGFAIIMTYKFWEHYSFRKKLLEDATEIVRGDVYDQFITIKSEMGLNDKDKIRLYISGQVESPLTIGIFRDSICMVLPPRSFTKEELTFIFRHEMIHISREDARCKLFFTVCLAIFWFNPLMWIGFKKCRDDLELSCDETVLAGLDKEDRKEYARLILSSKGNDQGFSSCLSAKASTLRYRLKCVVEPKKHHFGALLVGILFFILAFTMESFVFASSGAPKDDDFDAMLYVSSKSIILSKDGISEHFETCDVEKLAVFMKDLDCYRLHSSIEVDFEKDSFEFWNHARTEGFILYDHYMIFRKDGEIYFYYMKDAVDFSVLQERISKGGL